MATRPLTQDEIDLARAVFQDNLPYKKIRIADDLGLGDAPWTDPFGAFFTIHMGPTAFGVGTSTTATAAYNAAKLDETFIHELTHVWQGSHGCRYAFVGGSVVAQARLGRKRVYNYLPDYPWESYNPEQQAQIVEDWYAGNPIANYKATFPAMDEKTSPLFKYIKDPIRTMKFPAPVEYYTY